MLFFFYSLKSKISLIFIKESKKINCLVDLRKMNISGNMSNDDVMKHLKSIDENLNFNVHLMTGLTENFGAPVK